MNLKKRRLAIFFGFVLMVLFSIGLYKINPWVRLTGAQIVPPSTTLIVGSSMHLSTKAWGSDGKFYNIAPQGWTCSDTTIARVNEEGVVTAVRPGKAEIKAVVSNKTAEATIIVFAADASTPDQYKE